MKKINIIISLILSLSFSNFAQDSINQNNTIKYSDTSFFNKYDENGLRTGKWVKFYNFEKGLIKYEGQFEKGKPNGLFMYYYNNGNLKSRMIYHNDGRNASANLFYKNGKPMGTGLYTEQKRDSTWKYYTSKGNLLCIEHYKDTLKNGKWITYHLDDTIISEECTYLNGKKDGDWIKYHTNGKLMSIAKYKDGLANGIYKFYDTNGSLMILGAYKNGLRFGKWQYFENSENEPDIFEYNSKGKLINPDEIEEKQQEIFKKMDEDIKKNMEKNTKNESSPFFMQE